MEAAKAAAAGTYHAEEADGLLYEIKYLSVGLPAPPVSGKPRNGRAIDLAALRGKAVVLVFQGTRLEPVCMEEVPLLRRLQAKYANQAAIIGIGIDVSVERVDRTIKEKQMTWPIPHGRQEAFDGPNCHGRYASSFAGACFVLDGDGQIFARLGSAQPLEEKLKDALR